MEKIMEKYPTKLHEDWRYYPLNKGKFESLIKDIEVNNAGEDELLSEDFLNESFKIEKDSFSESVLQFKKRRENLLINKSNSNFVIDLITDNNLINSFRKLNVLVEEGINGNLTINYNSKTDSESILNSIIKLKLRKNSTLNVYITGSGRNNHLHFMKFLSEVDLNGKLNVFNLQTTESTVRAEYFVTLGGDFSEFLYNQAVIETDTGINEVVAKVFHKGKNTKSDLKNLSYVSGNSKSILNGLLKVYESAKDTKAYQSAKSFLLSDNANSVSYPQLEIENPDVECSHGAAVLSFDENQLFYLQSRGLSKREASEMILKGILDFFYKEMDNEMKDKFLEKGYEKIGELQL